MNARTHAIEDMKSEIMNRFNSIPRFLDEFDIFFKESFHRHPLSNSLRKKDFFAEKGSCCFYSTPYQANLSCISNFQLYICFMITRVAKVMIEKAV